MRAENKLANTDIPNLMESDINRVKEQIEYMGSTSDAFKTYFNQLSDVF